MGIYFEYQIFKNPRLQKAWFLSLISISIKIAQAHQIGPLKKVMATIITRNGQILVRMIISALTFIIT